MVPSLSDQYSKALEAYKRALVLNPNNPEIFRLLAELEAANGDYNAARQYAIQAIVKKTNYSAAYLTTALIEVSRGNIEEGIKILESAVRIIPSEMTLVYQLGLLYRDSGQYAKAVDALSYLLTQIPEHSDARFSLALVYEKQGRVSAALKELREVLKHNPNNQIILDVIRRLENSTKTSSK